MRHLFHRSGYPFVKIAQLLCNIEQRHRLYVSGKPIMLFCGIDNNFSTLPEKSGRLFHLFVLKSGQKIALLIAHQTLLKAFGIGYAGK